VRRPDLLIALFRALLVAASLWWLPCVRAPLVRADDLSEFETARSRYDRHDYARAAEAFRKLVGTDPPRIANALLVLESRKYFAASLLFLGAATDARLQFRLLLQQEPEYALDPLAFPTEVVALFDEVKSALRRELDNKREAELSQQREAAQQAATAEQLRRHNLERLRGLAEEHVVRTENSRWVAGVPFGVGQFQNGHRGLGVALAMAEGLAGAASIGTFVGHQSLANERPSASNVASLQDDQRRLVTANWLSFGTFAALAIIGIVDAHLRFVPGKVTTAQRPLPPDLDRWVKDEAKRVTAPPRF
jgi:hypothetical protein